MQYTGARLVLHASDDWVLDWPANIMQRRVPVLSNHIARTVGTEYAELVRIAALRMAISNKMAAAYGERYGDRWEVFFNPIDPIDWPDRTTRQPRGSTFRMLYSGSVASQLDTLLIVADSVAQLRATGVKVELIISTRGIDPQLQAKFAHLGVTFAPLVPVEALPSKLADADLLLLPITFDPLQFKFIRLSVPGKSSEYMASGTPILVVGPASNAMVEYALADGWAYVVTVPSAQEVTAAIEQLMADPQLRARYAARARTVALRDCDVNTMRHRFRGFMLSLVQAGGRGPS